MTKEMYLLELVKRHYPEIMKTESTFMANDLCDKIGIDYRTVVSEALYSKMIRHLREKNKDG